MSTAHKYDVIIVGGGLAGLVCAIGLADSNRKVLLLEKKHYPFHKVCGEYVSNEVLSYLKHLGFDPFRLGASSIHKLRVSTPGGKNIYLPLDKGGFGLSRYTMDNALCALAVQKGAEVLTGERVVNMQYDAGIFAVETANGEIYTSKLVVGSFGKRESLDKKLDRAFIKEHTGFLGVKYHIETDYPADEIGLDNFKNGYCGIVRIEGNKYNLCYLYKRSRQKEYDNIKDLEERILFKNPMLKGIFKNSTFIYDEPEVINEISFAKKEQVKDHVLMCGDSAGLITPLCGNGMAMAITAAKLLAGLIIQTGILEHHSVPEDERTKLEMNYQQEWNKLFRKRLYWGRVVQSMLGNQSLSSAFIRTVHAIAPLEKRLLALTHGEDIFNG